ncbi:glycosyltransferase family 2 protein [Nibrella saemangeumensis]|uniref:Glycosyltransferase family 2 protein n=1 Tax=Nibrella saemangeumensis TaxID=1084526 RepID=A0ABP8NBW0_9BACT
METLHDPTKLPLSVVIITLNAERTLLQTLTSVIDWAGEIVVVDSGSTDATLTIARIMGCQIYHRTFDGYGPQKQFAVDQATNDWVLLLDADEVVDKELQREIWRAMAIPPDAQQAFSVSRRLIFMGRAMQHIGESRKPLVRLFNRKQSKVSSAMVHEQVEVAGDTVPLTGLLWHYSYGSLHEYLEKLNRYTTIGAGELVKAGRRQSRLLLPFRFLWTFLSIYVFKGGFLDGFAGFTWALFSAIYPVAKYTKLHELRTSQSAMHPEPTKSKNPIATLNENER